MNVFVYVNGEALYMIPLVYDQINHWGRDDEFFLALLKKLKVEIIADLGCGTGRWTTHLVPEFFLHQ